MTSNMKTNLGFSFDRLCRVAEEKEHKDGWGIAWLEGRNIQHDKGGTPLWKSDRARELIGRVNSRLIIVHARKRSPDSPRAARVNSHPFINKALGRRWVFAHNGSVSVDYPESKRKLTSEGVDSERFFHYLLNTMEDIGGEEPDTVQVALRKREFWEKIDVKSSLNFILASKNYLYAFRYHVERAAYYTLYWLRRTWKDAMGKEIKKREGEIAFIVCSEKLTEKPWYSIDMERWKPMENGEMLIVKVGEPCEVNCTKLFP